MNWFQIVEVKDFWAFHVELKYITYIIYLNEMQNFGIPMYNRSRLDNQLRVLDLFVSEWSLLEPLHEQLEETSQIQRTQKDL